MALAIFGLEPGAPVSALQVMTNARVQVLAGLVIAAISAISYITSLRTELNQLRSSKKDDHDLIIQIGISLGVPGLNLTDHLSTVQKINEFIKFHSDCLGRVTSVTNMFESVNNHSSLSWSQSNKKIQDSMALAQLPKPLALSIDDTLFSGIQISSVYDKLQCCHLQNINYEEQTKRLEEKVAKSDQRAEIHHEETIKATNNVFDAQKTIIEKVTLMGDSNVEAAKMKAQLDTCQNELYKYEHPITTFLRSLKFW